MTTRPLETIPNHPFDYLHFRHLGSQLLRFCALCGGELEYMGETPDEANRRENASDPWEYGSGADCTPTHKNRDSRLDHDDHDRCQC